MTGAGTEVPPPPSAALTRLATALLRVVGVASLALGCLALYRLGLRPRFVAVAMYALAALGVGVSVLGARLHAEARVTLALVITLAGLLLYIAEAALDLAEPFRMIGIHRAMEARSGLPFDPRTQNETIRDLRTYGIPAYPAIVPTMVLQSGRSQFSPLRRFFTDVLPLAGISDVPTIPPSVEDGRWHVYRTDRHGFWNPESAWNVDSSPVVLIGDSFAHGMGVSGSQTLAADLRHRWPDLLNLGQSGDGSLSELATLTEYAVPLRPRVVLWFYFENDLDDLRRERMDSTLIRYLEPTFSQHLMDRQAEIDNAEQQWANAFLASGFGWRDYPGFVWRPFLTLAAIRSIVVNSVAPDPAADDPSQLTLFRTVLAEAKRRTSAAGGRLIFVFLPSWQRYFDSAWLQGDHTRDRVLETAQSLDLPVIDVAPRFARRRDLAALFSRGAMMRGHYSAQGYAVVADAVEDAFGAASAPGLHPSGPAPTRRAP